MVSNCKLSVKTVGLLKTLTILDFQRPMMQSSVLTFTSFEPMGSWTLGGRMMNPMLRGASSENASTGTMFISVATQRNGARAMCV